MAGSHLSTSFHSGPEPEAAPPLLQVKAAKWSLMCASWDHPQGFCSWLRIVREYSLVAMSLSALDVSQNIPNAGRKEKGSNGIRFQLYPSRGFPFAMEIQKGHLNPLCTATEMGKTRAPSNVSNFIFRDNFFPILSVQMQARLSVTSMEQLLSPIPVPEGHKCSLQN